MGIDHAVGVVLVGTVSAYSWTVLCDSMRSNDDMQSISDLALVMTIANNINGGTVASRR